jgi:uncharacterized protein (TIGR03492 family)
MGIIGKSILFLSNGHGEDLNSSEVLRALRQKYSSITVAAMPLVGEGNAYRRLGVEIICPTRSLPSGGFVYMNQTKLAEDVQSGLLKLVWRQIQALRACRQNYDLIFAAGDIVSLAFARLTGRPYAAFIVSASAHYENRMKPPFLTDRLLRSPHCKIIFTRDAFTAKLLNQQGVSKAVFAGYPIMDVLTPTGKPLDLVANVPAIALLPGSRLPEACQNLGLQLDLVVAIVRTFAPEPVQFYAAIVPSMMEEELLQEVAIAHGWQYLGNGKLAHASSGAFVMCHSDAFPDILHQCNLAIGMAGTAVEQAVGLGKPVIQIPGQGPQFTYRFAEAQMRLLGLSVQTIGKIPATAEILQEAAERVKQTLQDQDYLQGCVQNGLERVGKSGGSEGICDRLAEYLCNLSGKVSEA